MRVCIVTDAIAGCSSAETGDLLGRAFASCGALVAVIPAATTGKPLRTAMDRIYPGMRIVRAHTIGQVAAALAIPSDEPWILDAHELTDASVVEVFDVTTIAPQPGLIAVVAEPELPLTGMPGMIAQRGRASGDDLAHTLELNDRATSWLSRIGVEDQPGAGAAGGVGALVLAAGGQVTSGVEACLQLTHADRAIGQADVIVTGAQSLDFVTIGGPVVRAMIERASAGMSPLIAVAGYNHISARELRTLGVEAAYPVVSDPHDEVTVDGLRALAKRVAATWRW